MEVEDREQGHHLHINLASLPQIIGGYLCIPRRFFGPTVYSLRCQRSALKKNQRQQKNHSFDGMEDFIF